MPPIYAIRANHNDPNNNFIFFYEWVLMDLKDNSIIEKKVVCEYIENKQKPFFGKECHKDGNDVGLYPELPVMEITRIEFVMITAFILLLIGALVMVFEFYNLYFICVDENGSLYRSFQDIMFISPIVLIVLLGTILLYKYYIKRYVLI